jgi:probable biosynthetic protein (TIGR04099 family)
VPVVRRAVPLSNRHVERGVPECADGIENWSSDLAASPRRLRPERWLEHLGFIRSQSSVLATFPFDPCPHNDFNGADFLYFASFQSIVDRAEWSWCARHDLIARTRHRELFYYGNTDLGDRLNVVLCAKRGGTACDAELHHWCRIYRVGDQKLIADVFTLKRFEPRVPADRQNHRQAAFAAEQ